MSVATVGSTLSAMKNKNVLVVLISIVASLISGAVFVGALFRQFALVEVAASILTGLQVFFLSSAIGDLLEEKKEYNWTRNAAVLAIVVFLVGFYTIRRYLY